MRSNGLCGAGVTAVWIDRLEQAGIRGPGAKALEPATVRILASEVTGRQCARAVGILGLQNRGNATVGRVEHAVAFAVGCVETREQTQVLREPGVDMRRR